MKKDSTKIPRRAFLNKRTPLENLCSVLINAIESQGSHPLLTKAETKILEAFSLIADWIDDDAPGAINDWVKEPGPYPNSKHDISKWNHIKLIDF